MGRHSPGGGRQGGWKGCYQGGQGSHHEGEAKNHQTREITTGQAQLGGLGAGQNMRPGDTTANQRQVLTWMPALDQLQNCNSLELFFNTLISIRDNAMLGETYVEI